MSCLPRTLFRRSHRSSGKTLTPTEERENADFSRSTAPLRASSHLSTSATLKETEVTKLTAAEEHSGDHNLEVESQSNFTKQPTQPQRQETSTPGLNSASPSASLLLAPSTSSSTDLDFERMTTIVGPPMMRQPEFYPDNAAVKSAL